VGEGVELGDVEKSNDVVAVLVGFRFVAPSVTPSTR
jgi:hypothetical protein